MKISIPTDENGLTGRECPNTECLGSFKIKFGTGLDGENLPCHCPYCGHVATPDNFWTQDQLKYIESIAVNEMTKSLKSYVNKWDRSLRQNTRNSFIKMSVNYKSNPHPIRYYQEEQIETSVTCDVCTLEYAIYGIFAFCPDCGTHNSVQILTKNLELVEKEVAFSKTIEDKELAGRLVDDALENAVSSFDGFGRATCTAFANKTKDENQAKEITFQNLGNAQIKVQKLFGFDIAKGVNQQDWDFVIRSFQKRHLLAHKMGVIDDEYIKKSKDLTAVAGRKIVVTSEEVLRLAQLIRAIGNNLFDNLKS